MPGNEFLKPPCFEDLRRAVQCILREFNPKKMVFIDDHGKWRNNPISLRDRAVNEILYETWKKQAKGKKDFLPSLLYPLTKNNTWETAKKLALLAKQKEDLYPTSSPGKTIQKTSQEQADSNFSAVFKEFLVALEAYIFLLKRYIIKSCSEVDVPHWKKDAQLLKKSFCQELNEIDNRLSEALNQNQKPSSPAELKESLFTQDNSFPEFLVQRLAEEEIITRKIQQYLIKAGQSSQPDDSYSIILEQLKPDMGVVDYTSPALLRPCLSLLINTDLPLESGIQYTASVILSILNDPRCTETLLECLKLFPVHHSKLRENIIYTLGNLKEEEAVESIAKVLSEPDEIVYTGKNQNKESCLLQGQKEEAIWALGKIGLPSLPIIEHLNPYVSHSSPYLQSYLAWSLGEIGRAQRASHGGVSVDISLNLLQLLKTKNKMVFEETVQALRKIELPEFLHSLYLYNVGAINILDLKPAQRGLYELSETIQALLQKKGQVILAVNGDSGTGKTYFCRALKKGFGNIKPGEILYLMRDRKRDQRIFNRILGLKWLKKHIEPIYYEDLSLEEKEDSPEEFLNVFFKQQAGKKIILLDGCRDKHYFQRVIDLFYFHGKLDTAVNFRATLSTRRQNLEEREAALESVKNHLSFVEEPALEDTWFYQEAKIPIYDLDNSFSSRLNEEEIKELFSQQKIDYWENLIFPGRFEGEKSQVDSTILPLKTYSEYSFNLKNESWPEIEEKNFFPREKKFKPELNLDLQTEPRLLQTITINDFKPQQLCFYAQNQFGGIGDEGTFFVCSFIDNHLFFTKFYPSTGFNLLGRTFFMQDGEGSLRFISFEKNLQGKFIHTYPPVTALSTSPSGQMVTGHEDGSLRVWDFGQKELLAFHPHEDKVTSVALNYFGRIFSVSGKNKLFMYDINSKKYHLLSHYSGNISQISSYPNNNFMLLSFSKEKPFYPEITILDFSNKTVKQLKTLRNKIFRISSLPDGRILACGRSENEINGQIFILEENNNCFWKQSWRAHSDKIEDIINWGPKLISCGEEKNGLSTIKIWGSEKYVSLEARRLAIQP